MITYFEYNLHIIGDYLLGEGWSLNNLAEYFVSEAAKTANKTEKPPFTPMTPIPHKEQELYPLKKRMLTADAIFGDEDNPTPPWWDEGEIGKLTPQELVFIKNMTWWPPSERDEESLRYLRKKATIKDPEEISGAGRYTLSPEEKEDVEKQIDTEVKELLARKAASDEQAKKKQLQSKGEVPYWLGAEKPRPSAQASEIPPDPKLAFGSIGWRNPYIDDEGKKRLGSVRDPLANLAFAKNKLTPKKDDPGVSPEERKARLAQRRKVTKVDWDTTPPQALGAIRRSEPAFTDKLRQLFKTVTLEPGTGERGNFERDPLDVTPTKMPVRPDSDQPQPIMFRTPSTIKQDIPSSRLYQRRIPQYDPKTGKPIYPSKKEEIDDQLTPEDRARMEKVAPKAIEVMNKLYSRAQTYMGEPIVLPPNRASEFIEFLQSDKEKRQRNKQGVQLTVQTLYPPVHDGKEWTMYPSKTRPLVQSDIEDAIKTTVAPQADQHPVYAIRSTPMQPPIIFAGHRYWFAKALRQLEKLVKHKEMSNLAQQMQQYPPSAPRPERLSVVLVNAPWDIVADAAKRWNEKNPQEPVANLGSNRGAFIVPAGTKVLIKKFDILRQNQEGDQYTGEQPETVKINNPYEFKNDEVDKSLTSQEISKMMRFEKIIQDDDGRVWLYKISVPTNRVQLKIGDEISSISGE